MATIINCLRVVPKVTNTNTEPFVSLFTKRASRLAIVASFSSSTMSYEKELAAANKAASLAARLCQASLSLSLACILCSFFDCMNVNAHKRDRHSKFLFLWLCNVWYLEWCVCVCVFWSVLGVLLIWR